MKYLLSLFSLCACSLHGFLMPYPCPPPMVCEPIFLPPPPPMWQPMCPPPRVWVPVNVPCPRPHQHRSHCCHQHAQPQPSCQPPSQSSPQIAAKPRINPLSSSEVKEVIHRFNQLIEDEGHFVDLFTLLDPQVVIKEDEYTYHGHRGAEDYCRERPVDYFDEVRKTTLMEIALRDDQAKVKTVEEWSARVLRGSQSEPVKAQMAYAWVIKRQEESGKAVIVSLTLEDCTLLEGNL